LVIYRARQQYLPMTTSSIILKRRDTEEVFGKEALRRQDGM
jgi:hypothetical protein